MCMISRSCRVEPVVNMTAIWVLPYSLAPLISVPRPISISNSSMIKTRDSMLSKMFNCDFGKGRSGWVGFILCSRPQS